MSGEYFGRLIATGEWGICLLSIKRVTFKIKNKKNLLKVKILSLDITYMVFFGVTVHEID